MRSLIALAWTIAFLASSALCNPTNAPGSFSAEAGFDAISAALSRGEVGRVELLRVPPNLETRAAITPEALERIYYTKLVIRNIAEMPLRRQMIEALKSTSIHPRDYIADVRWGLIFYSREDVRIGAIYFDRSGRNGAVNDAGATFHGRLFNWMETTFSACP